MPAESTTPVEITSNLMDRTFQTNKTEHFILKSAAHLFAFLGFRQEATPLAKKTTRLQALETNLWVKCAVGEKLGFGRPLACFSRFSAVGV